MRALMTWLLRLFLVLIVLLVITIVLAPAQLVLMAVQRWAPQMQVSEPAGTIWQGQLNHVDVTVNNATLALGKVSWELSPLSILKANPSIDLVVQAPTHQAQMRVSATGDQVVTIDKMEGSLMLSLLEPWVPLLVKGDLAFVVDHMVFNSQQLLGIDGALNFQQLDWLGGGNDMPLGSYIAQVSLTDNKDVLVLINDFSAMLGIDGSITINPTGSYQFDCVLQTRAGLAPEIAQSVAWFGKKNAQGDIVVNHRGRWN